MKKFLLSIGLSVLVALFGNLYSQTSSPALQSPPLSVCVEPPSSGPSSCAIICTNSGLFTDNLNGTFTFRFVFIKNSSGAKSININVICGTTEVLNDCIILTPLTEGLQYFVTSTFVCSSLSGVILTLTPRTNGTCGGGICGEVVRSIDGGPLPVKFKSFNAARNKSNVVLKWETVSEENSRGFDVQRIVGAGNWESIGLVASKSNNGNSSAILSYDFIDINTTKGISQYRLIQLDIDGKSSFSTIQSVRGDGQKSKTIVYPNPSFTGKVNVVFEDVNTVRDITLIDMNGRTVKQWLGTTNNNIQIENLNAGFYSIRIVNRETGEQAVEKIVVNKR